MNKKVSLKHKIFLFSLALLSLFIIASGISIYSLNLVNKNLVTMYNEDLTVLEKVLQADRDMHQSLVAERTYFLANTEELKKVLKEIHAENIEQANDRAASIEKRTHNSSDINKAYNDFKNRFKKWKSDSNNILVKFDSLPHEESIKEIQNNLITMDKEFNDAREPIDNLQNELIEDAQAKINSASKMYNLSLYIMGGTFLFGIALVIFMVINLNQSVANKLLHAVESLTKSNDKINEHTLDLDDTSKSLAASASEQSAASHESVAAMEEMSSMVDQTQNYVQSSINDLGDVNEKISAGKTTLNELINSMGEINKSSEKIQDIEKIIEMIDEKTSIINDIVFKTQLLSFNASIEAARAGQHGRGFSVVAEEVSNLATLSGQAAQEIQELLSKSKSQVSTLVIDTKKVTEQGKSVTDNVELLFNGINDLVLNINEQMGGVNTASTEQTAGIKQTLEAMNQLNLTTQQTNQISGHLEEKSGELSHLQTSLSHVIAELVMIVKGEQLKHTIKQKPHLTLVKTNEKINSDNEFEITADDFQRPA